MLIKASCPPLLAGKRVILNPVRHHFQSLQESQSLSSQVFQGQCMSIQNVIIFLIIFISSLALYFIVDKQIGSMTPWILITAFLLAFISYFIVKKTNYNWAAVAAIIGALGLFSQWGWNVYQDSNTKKLQHQHVKPDIRISMEYCTRRFALIRSLFFW